MNEASSRGLHQSQGLGQKRPELLTFMNLSHFFPQSSLQAFKIKVTGETIYLAEPKVHIIPCMSWENNNNSVLRTSIVGQMPVLDSLKNTDKLGEERFPKKIRVPLRRENECRAIGKLPGPKP